MLLSNAFSLQMIDLSKPGSISVKPLSVNEAIAIFKENGLESCVGHAEAAAKLSAILGIDVIMNRKSTLLSTGQSIVVAQVTGGRLPEGATMVPAEYEIKFLPNLQYSSEDHIP